MTNTGDYDEIGGQYGWAGYLTPHEELLAAIRQRFPGATEDQIITWLRKAVKGVQPYAELATPTGLSEALRNDSPEAWMLFTVAARGDIECKN